MTASILRSSRNRASGFLSTMSQWQRRLRSRSELMSLSDRSLQDMGLSRSDFKGDKPFWMA